MTCMITAIRQQLVTSISEPGNYEGQMPAAHLVKGLRGSDGLKSCFDKITIDVQTGEQIARFHIRPFHVPDICIMKSDKGGHNHDFLTRNLLIWICWTLGTFLTLHQHNVLQQSLPDLLIAPMYNTCNSSPDTNNTKPTLLKSYNCTSSVYQIVSTALSHVTMQYLNQKLNHSWCNKGSLMANKKEEKRFAQVYGISWCESWERECRVCIWEKFYGSNRQTSKFACKHPWTAYCSLDL